MRRRLPPHAPAESRSRHRTGMGTECSRPANVATRRLACGEDRAPVETDPSAPQDSRRMRGRAFRPAPSSLSSMSSYLSSWREQTRQTRPLPEHGEGGGWGRIARCHPRPRARFHALSRARQHIRNTARRRCLRCTVLENHGFRHSRTEWFGLGLGGFEGRPCPGDRSSATDIDVSGARLVPSSRFVGLRWAILAPAKPVA